MNLVRDIVARLCVIALWLLAVPAFGHHPNGQYSINVSAFGVSPVAITIKNETTSGSATIDSFVIKPPSGVTITGLASPKSSASATVKLKSDGKVYVNDFTGLKSGGNTPKSLTVYVNVSYGSGPSCGTNYTWRASVYEDNDFDDADFDPVAGTPPTNPTQSVSCSLQFVQQPQNAMSMGLVGGPVKVQGTPANAFTGKTITLGFASSPGGSPSFAPGTNVAPVDASGFATFSNLSIAGSPGTYTLSATTGVAGFPTATSAQFALAASDGVLDCQGQPNGQPDQFSGNNGAGSTAVSGNRGLNKDNSVCKLVAYDLSFLGAREIAFVWDTTNQPNAAFAYQVDWKPEFVDPVTGLPKRTKVAWTLTGSTPNYVVGRACLSPSLPYPYGTLGATIGPGDASFAVVPPATPVTLPATPFPVVVGNERMSVTGISGTTWTVTRGVGGTAAAGHLAAASVMSTPFPLDASALQVRMCIADELFVALPPDKCAPANAEASCTGVSTTIFDAGDGFVSRDF